ncbi:MAG: patatin-like phospholipase family protein [Methylococcaceae bacterium]
MRAKTRLLWLVYSIAVTGCSMFSYTNNPINRTNSQVAKASIEIVEPRGKFKDTLVILSLSGGGSRAAYWSAATMLALEKVFAEEGINLLQEVDAISAVSGGTLPAAYYAISTEPDDPPETAPSNRIWDEPTVKELMTRNYVLKWVGNWFWPTNMAKFWFTDYDRSDIMAQTLADNLFDKRIIGEDLTFGEMNFHRPNIILNATNGTSDKSEDKAQYKFGSPFTFTAEDFKQIESDINDYSISRAVMASAAFPAAFNYMTLKDFSERDQDKYIHVFDGGNFDNLGLHSVQRVIDTSKDKFKKIIVILVDSYTDSPGIDSAEADARGFFDYAVDLNFLDSLNSLLEVSRKRVLDIFKNNIKELDEISTLFYHLQFADIEDKPLRKALNMIKTDFKISPENSQYIDQAVARLIVKENPCLQAIKTILTGENGHGQPQYCQWRQ